MKDKLRIALFAAACAAVLALVVCILLFWLFPKVAYRRLVFSVLADDAVASAEAVTPNGVYPLTDKQIFAVVSWLAEYRSENKGITRAGSHDGYALHLKLSGDNAKEKVLYVEQRGVVFEGLLGYYRIETDVNEIYDLIIDLTRR